MLAYELVGKKEEALASYKKAGMWRECLNVAYSIPLPNPEFTQLALELAEYLVEHRSFVDAATLYVDYGTNDTSIEKAAKALVKGYYFDEAIRVVNMKCGPQKVSSIVHPAIIDCFSQTTELIGELKTQLAAQIPRLRILREKKAEDPENYFEGNTVDMDVPDNISVAPTDATTSASLFTRYTARTAGSRGTRASSKNRRREERKRARGKKGTVYEEEYVVNSIGRLIQRVEDIRSEVARLITALLMIDKRSEAGEIQKNFQKMVVDIRGCVPEVFSEPVSSSTISREQSSVTVVVPVVETFKGSGLLN
jgi:elongator complex protein 1